MITATTSLISFLQDGKMLSCRRWFISIILFGFNLSLVLVCLLSLGIFGPWASPFASNRLNAMEITAVKDGEIAADIELNNWTEAKRAKYSRFKLSFPENGIVHAKGAVPVGKGVVRVNILEINKKVNPSLEIKPTTASNYLNSRVKIKNIADRYGAIAAVNGGYFKPETGVPLGALMVDNELLTGPVYNRAAISINYDGTYSADRTDIKFYLKNKKTILKIDNLNQPRMLSTYSIIYNKKWGETAPPPPKYGANAVIRSGRIIGIYFRSVQIPKNPDEFVLQAPLKVIQNIQFQNNLKFEIEYPDSFKNAVHLISGGPFLIKNNEIFIDAKEERLSSVQGRNPRTLIGYTKDNSLIIVTADGREKQSIGMSLYEAAKFMQKLGCISAINLDGGSSSVMYLKGEITNKPAAAGGIPISGALTVSVNRTVAAKSNTSHQM